VKLLAELNERKKVIPTTQSVRKSFVSCFVRAGEKALRTSHHVPNRGLLAIANDWQLLVDYDHKKIVFPPAICSTSERPDIILWSRMSRRVLLVELTCPAEEGIRAAQIKKETRYFKLLQNITENTSWSPELLTIEVGARGLVAGSTFRTFVRLGFLASEANSLCKTLSTVVARCSYAIYLAHNSRVWSHNADLVLMSSNSPTARTQKEELVLTKSNPPTTSTRELPTTEARIDPINSPSPRPQGDDMPPPVFCEFPVGPKVVSCRDCVPGLRYVVKAAAHVTSASASFVGSTKIVSVLILAQEDTR
jgi:hypothetical protein